jgi:hypothetical protein
VLVKHWSNTGQVLVDYGGQTVLAKQRLSNTGRAVLVKWWSNGPGQTLDRQRCQPALTGKCWSNAGPMPVKYGRAAGPGAGRNRDYSAALHRSNTD